MAQKDLCRRGWDQRSVVSVGGLGMLTLQGTSGALRIATTAVLRTP